MNSEEHAHITDTIEKESFVQDLTNRVLLNSLMLLCKQNQRLISFIKDIAETGSKETKKQCETVLKEIKAMENSDDSE